MRSVEQHLHAVRQTLRPPRGLNCPLEQALGRITRVDAVAAHDQPRFDNSQMDGYALPHCRGGSYRVAATIAAGVDPAPLEPGTVMAIMTGAKIPQGTQAIVPVERCEPDAFVAAGEKVSVPDAKPGAYIRRAGSDTARGEVLIPAGTRLNPAGIGTLAAQGITHVEVEAPARILIVTGGAEVGGTGAAAIPDSNGPMLAALAQRYGIEVAAHLHTNDDPDQLRAELTAAAQRVQPDAIVTSGGISHGKFEVIRQVLGPHGWFGHVAQQPGGPQGLAEFHGVPVVCLPGNPISTLVGFRLFLAPLLGHAPAARTALLAEPIAGLQGKEQFRRARLADGGDGTTRVHLVGGAGSHLLAQAVPADALVRIPAGSSLEPNDTVEVYPL